MRSKFLGIQGSVKEMALTGKLTQVVDSDREEVEED